MDKEIMQQTAMDYFEKHAQTGFISVPDTLANFGQKMYEAGQRAERLRTNLLLKAIGAVDLELDELDFAEYHTGEEIDHFKKAQANLHRICRELRADPAESGE